MARGGARVGAGRKKGSVTPKTQRKIDIIEMASREGMTPLEVLLKGMRDALAANNIKEACFYAKDAAPYVHPKLATVQHQGDDERPMAFRVLDVLTGVPRAGEDDEDAARRPH